MTAYRRIRGGDREFILKCHGREARSRRIRRTKTGGRAGDCCVEREVKIIIIRLRRRDESGGSFTKAIIRLFSIIK